MSTIALTEDTFADTITKPDSTYFGRTVTPPGSASAAEVVWQ